MKKKLIEGTAMDQETIIAIVGLIGSGKTEAAQKFIDAGFIRVGFNDRVYEELDRRGLNRIEKNERLVREEMRKNEGMAVMAKRSLPKIEDALKLGKKIAIESLYSWDEYKVMKEKFGDRFRMLAIYAPARIRYARLASRAVRPLTSEEASSRDHSQIENLAQAGPIAMADWTIKNTGTKEEFGEKIDEFISAL